MRLIDADALMEWIDVGHLRSPHELCFSELDVADMIDRMPTIEQPHWIPFSERLPKEGEEVLCSLPENEEFVACVRQGRWLFPSHYWVGLDGAGALHTDPIAWMPLPEPYKEEE